MRRSILRLVPVALIACLAFPGCGSKTTVVTGKVTYKGKPLTSGAVAFHGADGRSDSGRIDPDGNYTVSQAPLGPVKIAVLVAAPREGAPPKPPKDFQSKSKPKEADKDAVRPPVGKYVPIPDKYKDPEKSGLTYDVKPGKQTHDIELTD